MKLLLYGLFSLLPAFAQCTLTGVTVSLGTTNTITYTGSTGAGCAGASLGPVTIDATSGDIHTPGALFVGEGSGAAGAISLSQGTAPTSLLPNSVAIYAPTSIPSAYQWVMPSADGAGCLSSSGAAVPGIIGITACSGGGGVISGALVLVEQHPATGAASLDFAACITSTYDDYLIELVGILPTTAGANVQMRMSTNGGSSFDAGANYSWVGSRQSVGGSAGSVGSAATTSFGLDVSGGVSSSTTSGTFGSRISLFGPLAGTGYPRIIAQSGAWDNTANPDIWSIMVGSYKSLTPVNAFQIKASSGNLTSGVARCYGIAK